MATKAQDTFTDTDNTALNAHTPDTGTGWTCITGWKIGKFDANEVSAPTNATIEAAMEDTDIGDDDMDVSVDLSNAWDTADDSDQIGAAGRILSTNQASIDDNHYRAVADVVNGASMGFELFKVVTGTETSLGTHAQDPATGDTIKLEIRTGTKKLYVNGSELISSSDDSLTGNQFAGITHNGQKETHYYDNFLSEDVAAAANPKGPLGHPLHGPFGGPI